MVDAPVGALAAPEGHLEGVDDQVGPAVGPEGPAQHTAAVGVDDEGAVEPALAGAVLGDVRHPEPVRAVDGEVPLDEIL
jgi:hypothetical protein